MGRLEELRGKYGEWMKSDDVIEATGIGSSCSPGHYAVKGAKQRRMVVKGRRRLLYRTADIARNLDKHDEQLAETEATPAAKSPLCRSCRWSSKDNRSSSTLYCAYCLQPGHKTKHWHKEHGIVDALDIEHCPFYVPGQRERLPGSDWLAPEKKGCVTENEKH